MQAGAGQMQAGVPTAGAEQPSSDVQYCVLELVVSSGSRASHKPQVQRDPLLQYSTVLVP